MLFKKKKEKIYDFNYKIIFKSGLKLEGNVENSNLDPTDMFLYNRMNICEDKKAYFWNKDNIDYIEIINLTEK